jgi:hypothetical protein
MHVGCMRFAALWCVVCAHVKQLQVVELWGLHQQQLTQVGCKMKGGLFAVERGLGTLVL